VQVLAAMNLLPETQAPSRIPTPLDSHRQSFAEEGFLVFRDVVPRQRLADLHQRLRREFERAQLAGTLFAGGGTLAGHLNCAPGEAARFVFDCLIDAGIIDIIEALSDRPLRLPNVGCNFNLPGSVVQHWHMDRPFTKSFLIANVAVVDTDLENGAMEGVPGSHRRFYKYWQFALERAAMRLPSRRIPLRQGDVLVRTSSLWHRGMPNRTSEPRPMLAFTWEDGGSAHADPFHVGGGEIAFRQNWYGSDLSGRLRERMYVAAPFTYDAWRIARSMVGTKGYDH
jgi:ectoine hydroxylase-related dioxygenase (phytanoyl-CoA dioxygenase family)